MLSHFKYLPLILISLASFTTYAFSETKSTSLDNKPFLYITLPEGVVTPDGITLDKSGNIYVSAPNFSNEVLVKEGVISKAKPEKIVMFDANKKPSDFYIFSKKDKQKDTGKVGPMELTFGPDGNLYVADMQVIIYNSKQASF
jgi:hypothetical protein